MAEMAVYNPFDFFLEPSAEHVSVLVRDVRAAASCSRISCTSAPTHAAVRRYLDGDRSPAAADDRLPGRPQPQLQQRHHVRHPARSRRADVEQTLELASGSCRDTTWLLVQTVRHLGLAARFVSGYLIQLVAGREGAGRTARAPSGLHRPPRVVRGVPAGRGLGRPRSDLGTARRRRAHSRWPARPSQRAPRRSPAASSECEVEFVHEMSVQRIAESPRVTKPYTEAQWETILALGRAVDARPASRRRAPDDGRRADVRLGRRSRRRRMEHRRARADETRARRRSPAATASAVRRERLRALRAGQVVSGRAAAALGAWLLLARATASRPGQDPALYRRRAASDGHGATDAERFLAALAAKSGCDPRARAGRLRGRLVLPLARAAAAGRTSIRSTRVSTTSWSASACAASSRRVSTRSSVTRCRCARVGGRDGSLGDGAVVPARRAAVSGSRRLADGLSAAARLAAMGRADDRRSHQRARSVRAARAARGVGAAGRSPAASRPAAQAVPIRRQRAAQRSRQPGRSPARASRPRIVRTALCAEPRNGMLYIFMPPVEELEDYLELVAAVEATPRALGMPRDARGLPAAERPAARAVSGSRPIRA